MNLKKGDDVLFYLESDRRTSFLMAENLPDESLFRKTARIGVITEVLEDAYEITYVHLLISYIANVPARFVTSARMQSWNSFFGSFVNPTSYQPSSVIVVGAGGYLVYKYFN